MFFRDRLGINSKRTYTDEGYLVVPGRIGRIGIQDYLASEMGVSDRNPTDVIRVYRPQEEVFKDDSINSFANKPVTDNHPPELVNANNAKQYSVGHSGPEITRDGMFAEALLYITDANSIKNIESGKVELSNGYSCDIEWKSGITEDGESYDAIQRNIKGNHIAIVAKGRAGPSCKLADNSPETEAKQMLITIDSVQYEVSEQVAQAHQKVQARLNDAEAEAEKKDEELKEKDEEMAKKDEDLKEKEEEMAKKEEEMKVATDSAIEYRITLIADAQKLISNFDWKGKTNQIIISEVVSAKCPAIQMDSASPDYLKARFDLLVENVTNDSQADINNHFRKQASKVNDGNVVDTRSPSVIARDEMIARNKKLWKKEAN
jgi:hypothetical protein